MNCADCRATRRFHETSPMGVRYVVMKPITHNWIAEDSAPMYPDEGIFEIKTCYKFKLVDPAVHDATVPVVR